MRTRAAWQLRGRRERLRVVRYKHTQLQLPAAAPRRHHTTNALRQRIDRRLEFAPGFAMSLKNLEENPVRYRSRRKKKMPFHHTETERLADSYNTEQKSTRRRRIYDLLSHVPTFLVRFLRLVSFVLFLLPAFFVFAWYYAIAGDRVAVYYGKKKRARDPIFSRHILDIYGSRTPSPSGEEKKPVVIFVTGGAWIIGYRMWGCLLGRALAPFGVLVVMPDYTNFPKANIEGMVEDVDRSIQWTFDNIHKYGGDPARVVLVGQSAGAHVRKQPD